MESSVVNEFIDHISAVARQPELHMREIPILVGLAIVLIFIILVLVAMLFVHSDNRSTRRLEERQLKLIIKKRYIAGIIIGLISIISIGFAMAYASKPGFCAGCHEMRSSYKLSSESIHKNVECLSCHQEPGISGVFIEKLQLIEMMIAKYAAIGSVTEGSISNETCLGCHKNVLSTVVTKKGIKMRHKEPVEVGFKCLDCHFSNNLFHIEKRRLEKFGMSRCVDCHNQKDAPAECSTCHARSSVGKTSAKRDDYPKVNLPDKISCNGCHETTTCLKCHSLQIPHPEEWKASGHAVEAFVNKKLCWECHDQPGCQKCHPGTLPHGDGWVENHGPASRTASAPCSNCHKIEEYCLICHKNIDDFGLKTEISRPINLPPESSEVGTQEPGGKQPSE